MNMRKMKKQVYAVSPVIATLMLVLVSVGSAGAFYVWQNGWAQDVTDSAGGANIETSLKVGGSSTVWEFTSIAKEIFENQHSNFKIELQKGGSGSGLNGAGWGILDIGASSKGTGSVEEYFAELPDLDRDGTKDLGLEMKATLICYDGVAVVVADGSSHGLEEVNTSTLVALYTDQMTQWDDVPTNNTNGNATQCTGSTITTYDRLDDSGTEENFCKKLMGKPEGCSQMPYTGTTYTYAADESVSSNQALLDALAVDTEGIGFMSFGMMDDSVKQVPYADGKSAGELATSDSIADLTWAGSRPLNLITIGEPTGAAKVFVDFCLMSEMNQLIAQKAGYESIY